VDGLTTAVLGVLLARLSRSTVVTTPRKADLVADDDDTNSGGFR
jgi:hypothetical protein